MDGWMDNDSLLCISMCSPPFLPPWLHRVRRNVFHPPEYLDTSRQAYWTHYTVPPPLYPSCWSTFTQNPTRSFFFFLRGKTNRRRMGHFWSSTSEKKEEHIVCQRMTSWREIESDKDLCFIYIAMERRVDSETCPRWIVSARGIFESFVWRPCENERTARITLKDTMIQCFFSSPPKFCFVPDRVRFLFFLFISCFSSIFIIEGEKKKKIINNKPKKKNKVRAPCVRFLGAKKKKKKKERNVFRFHPLSILARHLQLRLMHKQLETAVSHYNTYIDLVLNGNGAGALSCATISGSAVS